MKIFKQTLQPGTTTIPHCARILSAANQHEAACVWYLHDEQAGSANIIAVETGRDKPDPSYGFVGTVLLSNGLYVLHIFAQRN